MLLHGRGSGPCSLHARKCSLYHCKGEANGRVRVQLIPESRPQRIESSRLVAASDSLRDDASVQWPRPEADPEAGEASSSPEAALLQDREELKRQGGVWARAKRLFFGQKLDRKRLAALGLGAVASYGFVSNATYGTGMAVSWVAFVKRTGRSPLMPGEWKAFLAFFAGFWTLQHFLRPLRFTLAVAMAPAFDRAIVGLQRLTGWNKRNAFGLYLVLFGSATSFLVFGSILVFAGPRAFARA